MTLRRDFIPTPNYSSRGSATVVRIVLHTAEGARTYQELGNFFANPASGVSSHVGIDDTPGVIGEYVQRDWKAWTASSANPWAVQVELSAFAEWSVEEWMAHPVMLSNCARWIAEEAAAFDIPIVGLDAAGAQDPNTRGVCQHNDLGSMGGGHWDCGPGFPIATVLELARTGGTPAPEPKADERMAATTTDTEGTVWYFTVDKAGGVWANAGGENDNWWALGGQVKGGPDATTQPDGTLVVAATGTDDAVWVSSRNPRNGEWSPWWSMGGK